MSPPVLADKLLSRLQEVADMVDLARDAPDELAVLTRLAEVYGRWAANRAHATPPPISDMKATIEKFRLQQATQQPPDVERMMKARSEPLEALLRAELAGASTPRAAAI